MYTLLPFIKSSPHAFKKKIKKDAFPIFFYPAFETSTKVGAGEDYEFENSC